MRNASLRVIAVGLAVGLWFFVNAGQHEAEMTLQIPVVYRGLPPGMMIVNTHPDFVSLQIDGPRTLLSLLDPGRLALKLELGGVSPGQADFKIGPEMFHVPRQTNISGIMPAEIRLDIDEVATRDVNVHPVLIGKPSDGYRIAAVEVNPDKVSVSGPKRVLAALDKIDTEPLDPRDYAKEPRDVRLVLPSGVLKVSTDQVLAAVRVQEIMASKEFRGVEVRVKDANFRFRVDPSRVNVMVRGPEREIARLSLEGVVYIEARGAAPGIYELPVQVDVPGGVADVHPVPEKVKLRVFAQKAG